MLLRLPHQRVPRGLLLVFLLLLWASCSSGPAASETKWLEGENRVQVEEEVKRRMKALIENFESPSREALNGFLAESVPVRITISGESTDRIGYLNAVDRMPADFLQSIEPGEITITLIPPSVALASGPIQSEVFRPQPSGLEKWFNEAVWIREQGEWRIVSFSTTLLN